MKLSTEAQIDYLDSYAKSGTRAGAARATGIDAMTAYRWLEGSKRASLTPDEPSPHFFAYRGVDGWFHEHAKNIVKATIVAIQDGVLDRALNGTTTVAMKDGQPVYLQNPEWPGDTDATRGMSDEDRIMLGYQPQWLRDANGKKILSMIHTPASTEWTMAVLAAFSRRWSKRATIEHNHNHQGGVAVQHSLASQPRKQLEERRDLPMLEIVEPVAETVSDLLEPSSEPSSEEPEKLDAEPAPEIAEPVPVAPARRATISPLMRDLIDRARQKGLPT